MKSFNLSFALLLVFFQASAQFHSLTLPLLSPKSSVSQQVGVTFIHVEYHSPSARGRDVWNNTNVIPQQGNPFPWRAGAQRNTTIEFDTDVFIEGQSLPAGKYGFHLIPNGHKHTLLFAKPNNLWGSYYLDLEKHIVLSVIVNDTNHQFKEHLSYYFDERTDSSTKIVLAWGNRSIPFTVSVDLNKTTIEKLRVDLNGESTYQWEAWNDAALWCLQRNTNLEEALIWANRSINGGLGGFAANRNLSNFGTKAKILDALGRRKEAQDTYQASFNLNFNQQEAQEYIQMLLLNRKDEHAMRFSKTAIEKYKEDWVLYLFQSVAYYYLEDSKAAIKSLAICKKHCPEWFNARLAIIETQMHEKEYQLNGRI